MVFSCNSCICLNGSYCYNVIIVILLQLSLCEKCPYSELFWSVFFSIRTKYREIRIISPYSVRMQENTDHNNSEYGHFFAQCLLCLNLKMEFKISFSSTTLSLMTNTQLSKKRFLPLDQLDTSKLSNKIRHFRGNYSVVKVAQFKTLLKPVATSKNVIYCFWLL